MKKLIALFLGLALIASFAFVISGCGSNSNPQVTINSPTAQPGGLTIRGTVYQGNLGGIGSIINLLLGTNVPTTIKGAPLAGVTLYLSGNSQTWTATTDANGEYSFTGLPQTAQQPSELLGKGPGYTIVANKDGFQRKIVENIQLSGSSALPDNSEITVDLTMCDNPVVLSVSPAGGTTIESGTVDFTVNFDEAMDTASVNPVIVAAGLRTYAAGDNQSVTRTWSNGDKTLTVTASNLLPNQFYQLVVDPIDANGRNMAKDKAGNLLDPLAIASEDILDLDKGSGGLTVWVYNSTTNPGGPVGSPDMAHTYRTAAGGVPGAPGDVQVTLGGKQPVNANYSDVHAGTPPDGAVGVYWSPASGQITGYRIYVAPSMSGPWQLATFEVVGATSWTGLVSDINQALFGVSLPSSPLSPNVDPVYWNKWAFENNKVYFRVVAFNGEGESDAATADAQEGIGPQLNTTVQEAPYTAGAPLVNNYWVPNLASTATDKTKVYIAFNEPIDPSSVAATNFTIPGVVVNNVTVMARSSADLGFFGGSDLSLLLVETDTDLTVGGPRTLTVTGVKDLAGNAVVTGTGDSVVIP